LELKTPADVALVGKCNVGKSTLIRALTGGRVKSDVGCWEGVTRGVVRGVVRVAQRREDGEERVWEGELGDVRVFDESMRVGGRQRVEVNEEGEFSPVPTKSGHGFDLYESFRFMITDNPGFVLPKTRTSNGREHQEAKITAEEDEQLAPITKTILRSIERARVLVYVVDLSTDAPWDELQEVIREVAHGQGQSAQRKSRKGLVVANKSDLLVRSEGSGASEEAGPESEEEVAKAQTKLRRLEEYVKQEMGDEVEVVPISAKWGMNLGKVVRSLEGLLKERVK
jgi:GTP-binding protein